MNKLILYLCTLTCLGCTSQTSDDDSTWSEYLGGPDRNHYTSLDQITRENVNKLEVAWEFHTNDSGQVQCNPIIVNGILYGVTASNTLFAVNNKNGAELWRFSGGNEKSFFNVNRGVTYWQDPKGKNPSRILYAYGEWLYAVDAKSGQKINSFGNEGRVSLKSGLGKNAQDKFVISSTPGTLYKDLIVMPLRVSEGADAAPGYIQAFNVISGEIEWVFHTIPHPGEFGHDTWPKDAYLNTEVGAANNWAGMSIDRKRGILFVPTGSAGFDFYGGNRKGQNLFANSLVALDAASGKRIWHFQFVHHDIWDRDLPAPPNLTTITKDGKKIDVVAQVTKTGHVFVFERENGNPIYPIDQIKVPSSELPEEETYPTQPFPRLPKPFVRQNLTEADINPLASNYSEILAVFQKSAKGTYKPLGKNNTILFPGADGGAEWGGAAVDKEGIMYVNSNEMAWNFSLSDTPKEDELAHMSVGEKAYFRNCTACHGKEFQGNPQSGFPSLQNLKSKLGKTEISKLISNGKGMMPGNSSITSIEKEALIQYLFGEEKKEVAGNSSKKNTVYVPYKFNGYHKFLDADGYPAITPPWGSLTAIDLNTGEHKWQIRLGEFKELKEKGLETTGSENYGGPLVTKSGLLFIAATKDGKFRCFDKNTGETLWETDLPAAGFATPSSYEIDGEQYIVIAAGGTKLGAPKGDSYIAFKLKENRLK
jgi:quinoprotein glucose dehydrogenase